MLGSMSQHLRVIVGLLDDLTLKDMETRLANWLLKRCPGRIGDHAVEVKLDRTKLVPAAGDGHNQRNTFTHAGEISRSKIPAGKRQHHHTHKTARTPKTVATKPGRIVARLLAKFVIHSR